jgi:hypothetical protein
MFAKNHEDEHASAVNTNEEAMKREREGTTQPLLNE